MRSSLPTTRYEITQLPGVVLSAGSETNRKVSEGQGPFKFSEADGRHGKTAHHPSRLFTFFPPPPPRTIVLLQGNPPGKHAGAHFSEKNNVPSTPPFLGNLQNETWGDHRTKHERLGRKTYSRRPWNRVPRRPQRRTKNSRESARAPVATRDTSPKPSRPPAVVGLPRLATRSPLSLPSPEARNLRDGGSQPFQTCDLGHAPEVARATSLVFASSSI